MEAGKVREQMSIDRLRRIAWDAAAGVFARYAETWQGRDSDPITPSTSSFPDHYSARECTIALEAARQGIAVFDEQRPLDDLIALLCRRLDSQFVVQEVVLRRGCTPSITSVILDPSSFGSGGPSDVDEDPPEPGENPPPRA